MPVAAKLFAAAPTTDTGVCDRRRVLRIPYHNKADGFMAAVLLALNQVKFCELHACRPLCMCDYLSPTMHFACRGFGCGSPLMHVWQLRATVVLHHVAAAYQ